SNNEHGMIAPAGSPNELRIATIALASPFFAAAVTSEDLCSGAGPNAGVSIRCIGERGAMKRVEVKRDGQGLAGSLGDAGAPAGPMRPRLAGVAAACIEMRGMPWRDLEPLRAAWGRDAPSARCEGKAPRPARVHAALDFPLAPGEPHFCDRRGG